LEEKLFAAGAFKGADSDIVKDGETVRVTLADSMARRQRRVIADAVAHDCRVFAGHRPGQCADAFGPALSMDGAFSTAFAMREQAFADLCRRSVNAWRTGDAVVAIAKPLAEPLNLAGPLPEPDDNDDNDNDDNNGDPLAKAMEDRERARLERDQRGDSAYKNPPSPYGGNLSNYGGVLDPREADRVEAIRRKTVLR
jgi:hypothetical protein